MEIHIDQIFEHFIRAKRFKTVAEILNANGYSTPNQNMITGQYVSRVLNNKKNVLSGLVSKELWDQAQEIVAANKRRGFSRRVAHLCSGLLKCSCGNAMYVPTNSKKYVCSKCRNKIAIDDMEAIVLENLKQSDIPNIEQGLSIWPSLSLAEKREIVESCVEQIIAEGKKVTVSLFAFG